MTIGVLQESVANQGGSATTLVISLVGLIAGSCVAIGVLRNQASVSITSVIGSVNGAYTARGTEAADATASRALILYTRDNVAAGAETVTITFSGATSQGSAVYAEIGDTSGFQIAASGNAQATPGTAADAVVSASASASAQPALVFAMSWNTTTTPDAAGTGFTAGQNADTSAAGGRVRTERKRITATGSNTATFTAPSDDRHLTVMAIFTETASATSLLKKLLLEMG